jgi:uncharacterized DUF497 family protein
MKQYDWNQEKNEWLRAERGITFENIIYHLDHGGLLDAIEHPNKKLYPNQRIFIVNVEGYVHLVPFVESEDTIFLKTIIPSRKMTKLYLGDLKNEIR